MKKILLFLIPVIFFALLLVVVAGEDAPEVSQELEKVHVSSQGMPGSETAADNETETGGEGNTDNDPLLFSPVDVLAEGPALKTASLITQNLVPCAGLDKETLEANVGFAHFLLHWANTTGVEFSYNNIFPLINSYNRQFYLPNCDKMIHQIFGVEEWNAETDFFTPPNGGFDLETNAWEFATDFGCCGITANRVNSEVVSEFSADGTQVVSIFEMLVYREGAADPEMVSAGIYRAVYDIVTEDGETFLRFSHFEKG